MNSSGKLSDAEFAQMLGLLKRYVTTEMDQWDLWKFDTTLSKIYVDISMKPSHPGTENAYTDLSHLFEKE